MEQRPALEEKQGSRELDELLRANVELQSQFDRKISQALSKARAGWERSMERHRPGLGRRKKRRRSRNGCSASGRRS